MTVKTAEGEQERTILELCLRHLATFNKHLFQGLLPHIMGIHFCKGDPGVAKHVTSNKMIKFTLKHFEYHFGIFNFEVR